MPTKLTVENLQSIKNAEITFTDQVTVIGGANGAGKSTLKRALTACFTGLALQEGVKKNEALMVVADAAEKSKGFAKIESGEALEHGFAVSYPTCAVKLKGTPPKSSPIPAGHVRFSSLAQGTRATMLAEILQSNPTQEDLKHLPNHEQIWKSLSTTDWDDLCRQFKGDAQQAKGAWREVTGQTWGSKVAQDWTPVVMPKKPIEQLKEELIVAQSVLAKASKAIIIGDHEKAQLESIAMQELISVHPPAEYESADTAIQKLLDTPAPQYPNLMRGFNAAKAEMDGVATKIKTLGNQTLSIVAVPDHIKDSNKNAECPECKVFLYVEGEKVFYPAYASREEIGNREQEIKSAVDENARITTLNANISEEVRDLAIGHTVLKDKVATLEKELNGKLEIFHQTRKQKIIEEENKLAKMRSDDRDAITKNQKIAEAQAKINAIQAQQSDIDPVAAQQAVTNRKSDIAKIEQKTRADHLQLQITEYLLIADALDKDGIRLTKMQGSVARFNETLAQICRIAEWSPVNMDKDLSIFFGSRPYALASESEQWRCDVAFQCAVAMLDNSAMIVIDRADVLRGVGVFALFLGMLDKIGVKAAVFVAMDKMDENCDYWIENGTVTRK